MLDPSSGRGAKSWQVFLACYIVALLAGLGTQFVRGTLRIGPADFVAPAIIAGFLTVFWWFAWGRRGR